jgi:long-chain acyl-CoA synthetase
MLKKPWVSSYEAQVPHSLQYPKITLNELFNDAARKYSDKPATKFVLRYLLGGKVTVGGSLTYMQLNTLINNFAAALAGMGVKKGDRVAVMLPNSPHFVIAFFAAMRLGAIVVNTNPTYTARELKHQLEDSGAETIVILNLFYPRLKEIVGDTHVKNTVVVYVHDTLAFPSSLLVKSAQKKDPEWNEPPTGAGVHNFEELIRTPGAPPRVEISADDVALFQYTGGTTGLPKAAMLTHFNLVANVLQTQAWDHTAKKGAEKVMSAIPFFHVYGMTVCMLYGLSCGAELVIVPNPRPIENVMRVIQNERCTTYPGVPAMYIGIVNHPRINEFNLRSVRVCISGSAPLPMEVQEKFGELTGGRLVEGYGLTEAAPVTHCNPIFGARKSGSVGVPYPDVEAKLIDLTTGAECEPGEDITGELCLRGPQVMKGYWNKPEETANTIDKDGWLHTGDICRMDGDGFFFIVDRKKDMINVGGLKVLPRDVEEVLFMHPKVQEATVIGIPHPTRGDDTLKAFVVLKQGMECSVDEIKEHCKKNLAPYKVPREVEFRKELPKTQIGKVLRRMLVEEEKQKMRG